MCSLTKHGKVLVLEFLGTGDHRLSPALFTEIMNQLEVVNSSEDVGALVTTNQGKFYCNGLDLEWVNVNTAERGPILYRKFEELLLAMLNVKVPTVAAICGHAAAGGLALAMAHDYRFMRADRGFLYSGALDVNVAVPSGSLELMASKMTPRVYRDVVLKCMKFTGKMALENELVDSLHDDPAQTLEAAIKEAELLAARNWDKKVYSSIRRTMFSRFVVLSPDFAWIGTTDADNEGWFMVQ
ncbi:hypothetical protein R1sor_018457 [Riccia sorocarpa]|uniref:Delta(3)-Delta(2)-enoyl-CoA isomerase n=1 Tax=Riccia sorocarpa TaxID=122646 RepID=A0ABD3IDB6_9MARC